MTDGVCDGTRSLGAANLLPCSQGFNSAGHPVSWDGI
jgi:hypothetical protein